MMVIAIGLSSYNIALFHLVNHAFYKALLFLGAGAVIHSVTDNQDFRKYGGLITYLPLSYSVMLIASLSLVAIPFMTGFYSKDFILESAYGALWCEIPLLCLFLSNSGNILKLLIPSSNLNFTSGWINYSCKVISKKIMETVMDYRGSKSITNLFILQICYVIVKEQRVDDSYHTNSMWLRCTLTGCESGYQIRIFPNQINKQVRYSSSSAINLNINRLQNPQINPWFVTGFIDAKGCFSLNIYRSNNLKTGWSVQLFFLISLHSKDRTHNPRKSSKLL